MIDKAKAQVKTRLLHAIELYLDHVIEEMDPIESVVIVMKQVKLVPFLLEELTDEQWYAAAHKHQSSLGLDA